jgi:Asp-tRNA(Asn)/Glu-tRNA(Gln) amidotransferase A subunit family amidase
MDRESGDASAAPTAQQATLGTQAAARRGAPSQSEDLCYASAGQLREWFETGVASPSEYVQAVLRRIETVNPRVNALVDVYADEAVALAAEASARYVKGRPHGPIDGVLVAIKDETPVEGKRTTSGSRRMADHVDDVSAVVVDRVRAAGGIVHARSAAPEFCAAPFTQSDLWGITRNPWNLGASPGGSSGGAGAALAAGMTTLADGSDVGGSIRIPACFSGVVGFRPPYGRVPGVAPYNLDPHCVQGPMARSTEDCARLESIMAGPDPSDPACVPRPPYVLAVQRRDLRGLRIGLSLDCGGFPLSEEVRSHTLAAAEQLRELGATVAEVEVGWSFEQVQRAALLHSGFYIGPAISRDDGVPLTSYVAKYLKRVSVVERSDFAEMLDLEGHIHSSLAAVMDQCDALLCPTMSLTHFEAGNDYVVEGPVVDGVATEQHRHVQLTLPFSICSRNPVISFPVGISESGVPVGVQIVTPPFEDCLAFDIARCFEESYPWPLANGPAGWRGSALAEL